MKKQWDKKEVARRLMVAAEAFRRWDDHGGHEMRTSFAQLDGFQ